MSQPISNLPVGSLVRDPNTKYNNDTIIWRVLEHGHTGDPANTTALEARDILTLKCFDAKEPNNTNTNRTKYGNNRYLYSNILQWLNSDAAANEWYTAQHEADQKPDSANVWASSETPINPYDNEAGFLSNFSSEFKAVLQTVNKTTAKNTVTDGGGYESVSSKIFLPSTTEIGLANENDVAEGSIYTYYSMDNTDARRKKVLANEAAKGNYPSGGNSWQLRTPNSSGTEAVRYVYGSGGRGSGYAYQGSYGVSPALCIPSTQAVSDQPDDNGVYRLVFKEKIVTLEDLARFKSNIMGSETVSVAYIANEKYGEILSRLLALIDLSKVNVNSYLTINTANDITIYRVAILGSTKMTLYNATYNNSQPTINIIYLASNNNTYKKGTITTASAAAYTDLTESTVPNYINSLTFHY